LGRALKIEAFVIYFNVFLKNWPGVDAGSLQRLNKAMKNLRQQDEDSNQAPSKQLQLKREYVHKMWKRD
jgi:hypothetical protein